MARKISILGFILSLLLSTALSSQQPQDSKSQAPQTGQPAQPSSSIYNRMRRNAPADAQQTTQAQQFPAPARQFPPDQQAPAAPGQRPAMNFPHPTLPSEQQPSPQPQATARTISPPAAPQAAQPQPQPSTGLAQLPANPPRISYVGGQLTIAAENSSLLDILTSVQRLTGARLEGTQPDSERVFGQFGPGAPREVLDSLLSGSRYDFILAGAVDDPGGVDRIMLSSRGASPTGNAGANQATGRQNLPSPSQVDEDNEGVAQAPEPLQQEPVHAPPPSAQFPPPGQQQVKTPEQLLEELQRLRQQQQQQQQTNSPR